MDNLLGVSQVLEIYNNFLLDKENKSQEERKKRRKANRTKTIFSASSAGQCYRKQLYNAREYDVTHTMDAENRATVRLGNLLHEDVQAALLSNYNPMMHDDNIIIEVEKRVESDIYLVSGYIDIFVYDKSTKKYHIIDLKSIKQWAYKKKFGLKKNRDPNPSENYELQVGTYGLILSDEYGNDGYGGGSIIYCRKDDSKFKEVKVDKNYVSLAEDYWKECNWLNETISEPDDLIPGQQGVPFQKWECNYCQFRGHCDSPFKKEDTNAKKE